MPSAQPTSRRIGPLALLLLAALLLLLAVPGGAAAAPHAHRHGDGAHHHGHRHAAHHHASHGRRLAARRAANTAIAPLRLFAPTSVWNRPVALGAPIDKSSPVLVRALVNEVAREFAARTGPWINAAKYSTPIYSVGASQPTVPVALDDPTALWRAPLQAAFQAVPIPADATAAVGTDGHMTIFQRSTDRLWEFWRARKLSDGWHAAWGGAIDHVSQSPGYYDVNSWTGAKPYWGATATSLPAAAGTMTIAELKAGRIDHALALAVPVARKGIWTWPAQRTDGISSDPTTLPEGAHLRLDPKLDVRALHLPRITEMMALAAQRYGIIVRDQTNHAIGFYAEDPAPTGGDPYRGAGGLYGGAWPTDFLSVFPWSSLRLLKMDVHGSL